MPEEKLTARPGEPADFRRAPEFIIFDAHMDPKTTSNSPSDTRLSLVLLLVGVAVCIIGYYQYRFFYHDDAYISLRYVHNFLDGHGLVWNPGERVEGYSNFLWVMLIGVLGFAGAELVFATRLLGVASFAATVVATYAWTRRLYPSSHFPAAAAAFLTLTALPLVVWSIGGLESVFFALLLLLSVWALQHAIDSDSRATIVAGLLFSLLSMTRPEGPIYLAGVVVYLAVHSLRRKELRVPSLAGIGIYAICFAAFVAWRFGYYGDILPNPYYVKADLSVDKVVRGLGYVSGYAVSLPYLLPLALASVVIVQTKTVWRPWISLAVICIGVHLFFVILTGGDHMQAFRFFVPIIPLLAMLVAAAAHSLAAIRPAPYVATALLALLAAAQLVWTAEPVRRARIMDGAAFHGRIIGEYINLFFPKGSLIALNTAGSTPYYAPDHRFIDMLGLNDRTIARRTEFPVLARWQSVPGHEKGDGAYVLSRKPDYLIAGGAAGYQITVDWFLTEQELQRLPEFAREYRIMMELIPVEHIAGHKAYSESRSGNLGFVYYERVRQDSAAGR